MKNNHTKNDIDNTLDLFLHKMAIIFLILITITITGFAILFTLSDSVPLKYFLYLYTVQHFLILFGIIYFKDLSIESVISFYLIYIISAIYPVACIYWSAGTPIAFSWYLLILIGTIAFNMQHIKVWILLIAISIISVFISSSFLFSQMNTGPLMIISANILTVIITVILTSFFALVYTKKANIEKSMHDKELQTYAENTENLEKDIILYNDIIEYLEKAKPFKNPDFNIQTLAKALNTNVYYISRAINVGSGNNFNMLLNSFRISYVKSMLDSGAIKKYTIDYIYAEAGYKYRSTFNAAFKLIIGMTPSDYVSQHKTNNNS